MPIVAVCVNERDVAIDILEKVSVSDAHLQSSLAKISKNRYIQEVVILSTCLRTEIYAFVSRFHEGIAALQDFFCTNLSNDKNLSDQLCQSLQVYFEEAAVTHLFEVASGVDSPVVGEGEILRQVKHAWEVAHTHKMCGTNMALLFRYAIMTGKKARTSTAISQGTTSLAHVAVELISKEHGGNLNDRKALVIGAGEMGSKLASALASKSVTNLTIANRGLARATTLAKTYGAKAIDMASLSSAIRDVDIVVTALANDDIVITQNVIKEIVNYRDTPIVLVDAAVPRAIDPLVADMEHVKLFNIDDLRLYAEKEMDSRKAAVYQVQGIVAAELKRYLDNAKSRQAAPLIKLIRSQATHVMEEELAKNQVFVGLDVNEQEKLKRAFESGMDKFLHQPTAVIKQAVTDGDSEVLLQALRTLFGFE